MSALDLGKVTGSRMYHTTGMPAPGMGLVEDWAVDAATGDVYEKTEDAAWTRRGNFMGPAGEPGPRGATGDMGPTGPAGAKGADGETPALSIDAAGHLIATYP